MNTEKHKQKLSTHPFTIAGLLCAGLTVVLLVMFVRHIIVTLPFPYPVEYGEGITLNWLLRFTGSESLYPPPALEGLPWLHNPYGPLWYIMAAPFTLFLDNVFTVGRLVSLLSIGLSACCIYILSRRYVSRMAAGALTVLFLGSPLVWRYGVMARVDMAAITAALVSIVLIVKSTLNAGDSEVQPAGWRSLAIFFASGAAASCALLIKPTVWAALAAGGLVGIKSGRNSFTAYASGAILPAAIFVLWGLLSADNAFLEHFTDMNRIGVSVSLLLRIILEGLSRHPFIILGLCTGLVSCAKKDAVWWFAFFSVMGLAGAVKIGADVHYFLPALCTGIIMTASLLGECKWKTASRNFIVWCLAAQLALYLPIAPQKVFTATYGQEIPSGHSALTPGEDDHRIGRLLVQEIRGAGGPVLSDDPGYILAADAELLVQPYQYGRLVQRGHIAAEGLVQRIQSGYFALIIIRMGYSSGPADSDFPPEVVEAVKDHYTLHREVGPYILYLY